MTVPLFIRNVYTRRKNLITKYVIQLLTVQMYRVTDIIKRIRTNLNTIDVQTVQGEMFTLTINHNIIA